MAGELPYAWPVYAVGTSFGCGWPSFTLQFGLTNTETKLEIIKPVPLSYGNRHTRRKRAAELRKQKR